MNTRKALLVASIVFAASAMAGAADWPRYLGPNLDNTVAADDLVRTFPDGEARVAWTVQVGRGYSGPVVDRGEVFLMDRKDQADVLRCFDLSTGREKWTVSYTARGKLSHSGSRQSPTVSDRYVITVGGFGDVRCLRRSDGEVLWKKQLSSDYGSRRPRWGFSCAPLVYKGAVILAPQSGKVGLVAVDPATGKDIWRGEPVGEMRYTSPVVATVDGTDVLLILNKDGLSVVSPASGAVLAQHRFECRHVIPSPLAVADGRVLLTGGYGAASELVRISRKGAAYDISTVWTQPEAASMIHTPILHEGHIYIDGRGGGGKQELVCLKADTGEVVWVADEAKNIDRGGMVLARGADLVFAVDGEDGLVRIIDPSPEGYKELAAAKVLEGKNMWGPIALGEGRLVVRDHDKMVCIDLRAE